MSVLNNGSISRTEKLVLIYVFLLLAFGVAMSWFNLSWFNEVYVIEDGFIESLTVLALLVVAFLTGKYVVRLSSKRHWMFTAAMTFLCLFSIFAAGEEISWGQRIFNVESSDFFQKNNAQGETNLHNLVVGGVKVNKLLFSQLFTVGAAVYLLILPYFYRKKAGFKGWIDKSGIPVPRWYQSIAVVVVSLFTVICNGRSSELQEFGACTVFFLIILNPLNREVFAETGK
ncbi:MAG TPA: hypothetical protein VGD90_02240 [Sphingobacteriaceae bacterium]